MIEMKMVPPDGGWGWVIVLAYALNSVIFLPIMQCFGLIFKDTFTLLGFSATDGAFIITTNAAVGMMSGLINGPLLKAYGYRKISYISVILLFIGLALTTFANSFTMLFVTYGLITSLGMGMGMSSYPLALNSYFIKNRGKATGIALTLTGIGPIVMPQLISFLMMEFGIKGAVLIMSGLSLHSFVSASLLQPVKWHMKKEIITDEIEIDDKTTKIILEDTKNNLLLKDEKDLTIINEEKLPMYESTLSLDYDYDYDSEMQTIYGYDTPLTGSVLSLYNGSRNRKYSISSFKSAISETNKGSTLKHLNGHQIKANDRRHSYFEVRDKLKEEEELLNDLNVNNVTKNDEKIYNPDMTILKEIPIREETLFKKLLKNIVKIFDLSLFKDPIYINIMIGMSLAIFAELNFSLLTPFILADLNLTTSQIAMFLSSLSIADLCFRFLAPFIGDYLNQPARIMYSISLIFLIITRFSLIMVDGYSQLIYVSIALGIAKGVRTVYMGLVIPTYVPIERLANASGLQMLVNGVFILIGGPIMGVIRDVTGSYVKCINILNFVTFTTLVIWSIEGIYVHCKNKKKSKEQQLDGFHSSSK